MSHVDSHKFSSVAKKRSESLPRQGEFVPHVPLPHPETQHNEKSQSLEASQKEYARLQGYDRQHRNPYADPYKVEPPLPSRVHHQEVKEVDEIPVHTHTMTKRDKTSFLLMRTLGNFLLFFSLYGVAATFGPALYFEGQYRVAQARGIEYTVDDPIAAQITPTGTPPTPTVAPDSTGFGAVIASADEQVLVPPDTQFSVVIPKIGATSKVYPNVDPLDESDFLPKLQSGVAHAKGTVFPGMQGNTYLFAHSTDNFWNVGRYNAVFYLLKELTPGDEVIVFFENTRHNYKVERTEIRDASDVELLVQSQQPGKEQLILQTCWPPGTTWKRMFIIATPQ